MPEPPWNAPEGRPRTGRKGPRRIPWLLGLSAPALVGCRGVQSALDSAGPDARRLEILSWVLFVGGAAIFILVTGLLLYALSAPHDRRRWLGTRRTIVAGGVVFPIVTLTAVLIYGFLVLRVTDAVGGEDALRIDVVGEQYWWRVDYPAEGSAPAVTTANEIQVPVGRPIRLFASSADVIHSIWIPNFAGKIDMIPGRINELGFTVERPGVYRGQCTEFCGDQHARMAFDVVALAPDEFEAWRRAQAQPAGVPAAPLIEKGRALFVSGGCGSCHAVRGTDSAGRLGPDLTHVGSRRTIGAGLYPTNVGTLAGWIADTQHLKAGVRMPSYGSLGGEDLRAIAGYLESLK